MSDLLATNVGQNRVAMEESRPRRSYLAVLGVLLVVVWIAVVSTIVMPLLQGKSVTWTAFWSTGLGVISAILIIFGVVLAAWVLRLSTGRPARGLRSERFEHRRHRAEGSTDRDPAFDLARERYARGEISQNQLEQILRGLREGSASPPS